MNQMKQKTNLIGKVLRHLNKYFTLKEVSIIFRRRPETLRRWVREGRLQALKIRNGFLIPESEIQKLKSEV